MALLIDDIAQYLATQGLGTVGVDIFKSFLPDKIDNVLVVLDTGGMQPDQDLPIRRPTFQIFIRSADYVTGRALVDSVRTALHQVTNTLIGGTYCYYILALSDGGHLGKNERGLDEFSINFHCKIR